LPAAFATSRLRYNGARFAPSGSARTFPARLAIVPEIAAFVEAFCARHAARRDDTLRLVLIVGELVTNTVEHGHRAECDARWHIACVVSGNPPWRRTCHAAH
jgi:anti-sigma regulatory factor (Ser/Thr protein kinase)